MSTIGRLTAALAAATSEVTVAAANINFDFSLVKCEAPLEFQTLGSMLTTTRRSDAESGSTHVTARRLGALFEGCCPATPNLLKAYGLRVSEISAAARTVNSIDYSDSIFSSYIGVDGTSIWAAATSSRASLHVHLLACMLARVFEANEAVAIWVELTKERKVDIATRFESGAQLPFSLAAAAAQNPITKSQLAEWDASARSWLRTADDVKKLEHSQFQTLLQNVALDVKEHNGVFRSVMEAWTSALSTMDNLISGQPQAVHDGSILLGLSAWHLYPNMAVFGSSSFEIIMDDNLVSPAGVLTMGLSPSRRTDSAGVSWCLSLAHLRHYGKPTRIERSIQQDPTRVSFPRFLLAALGTLTSPQQVMSREGAFGMKLLLIVCNALEKAAWVKHASLISRSLSTYIDADEDEFAKGKTLVQLGRRRLRFAAEEQGGDISAVCNPHHALIGSGGLYRCFKTTEMLITFLRHIIAGICGPGNYEVGDFMIRYSLRKDNSMLQRRNSRRGDEQHGHTRSMADYSAQVTDNVPLDNLYPESDTDDEEEYARMQFGYATATPEWCPSFASISGEEIPDLSSDSEIDSGAFSKHHRWIPTGARARNAADLESENCHVFDRAPFTTTSKTSFRVTVSTDVLSEYEFSFGDTNTAAVYRKKSVRDKAPAYKLKEEDLFWCKQSGYLSYSKLVFALSRHTSDFFNALAMVASVYKNLPDSTLAIQTLEKPILVSKWCSEKTKPISKILRQCRKRAVALAIAAYFDSGTCDLLPSDLDNIMAISSGDSIYVPRQLLCDPMERPKPRDLVRLLGNFGKPGVVLLRPVQDPMMRNLDYRKIMSITTPEFDGKQIDTFGSTSLHLSFTDHAVPVYDTNVRVGEDSQVSVIESFISVRDAGAWIADIDILDALSRDHVYRLSTQMPCNHPDHSFVDAGSGAWSIESWDEVLDCPPDRFVVRAHGNWLARLAITSVLSQVIQKKREGQVSICTQDTCWQCLWNENAVTGKEWSRHGFVY